MPSNPAPKWPAQANRNAFYGDPRGANGRVDPNWEAANIVRVDIPWRAVLAWDTDTVVKTIRCHRLCAESLKRVLAAIWAAAFRASQDHGAPGNSTAGAQKVIEAWGMHLYGGAYEFRQVRGGTSLSSHSWGCAIDWDPEGNGLGDSTPEFALPERAPVRAAFAAEGWTWGGSWSRHDGMHWQAASVS